MSIHQYKSPDCILQYQVPIDNIKFDSTKVFPAEQVAAMAKSLLRVGGFATPLQVRKDGSEWYTLVPGFELGLQAARLAQEINPRFELINCWIDIDFDEEPEPVTPTKVSAKSSKKEAVQKLVDSYLANPSVFPPKEQAKMRRLAAMLNAS